MTLKILFKLITLKLTVRVNDDPLLALLPSVEFLRSAPFIVGVDDVRSVPDGIVN